MQNEYVLHGPFNQILTMNYLPSCGPIKDENLEVIENGGIVLYKDKIIQIDKYLNLKKTI